MKAVFFSSSFFSTTDPLKGADFFGSRDPFSNDQSKSPVTHKILCFLKPGSGHFGDKIPILNRKI